MTELTASFILLGLTLASISLAYLGYVSFMASLFVMDKIFGIVLLFAGFGFFILTLELAYKIL